MDNFNYRRFGDHFDFVKAWIQERKRTAIVISLASTALMFTLIIQQVQISHLAAGLRVSDSYHYHRANAEMNYTLGHVEFTNNLSARIIQNSKEISMLKTEVKPKIDEHEEEIKELDEFLEKNIENSDYFENSSIALKSCAEWRRHGKTKSGYYKIDVDGPQFDVEAMVVYCEFYIIAPQLDKTIIKSNATFGKPSVAQIVALIEHFPSCSQNIEVHGNANPNFESTSIMKSPVYWKDRNGMFISFKH